MSKFAFLVRLLRNRGGNVAIMFALVAPVLVFGAGAAIDYERAAQIHTKLNAAADAAARAALTPQMMQLDEKIAEAAAFSLFNGLTHDISGLTQGGTKVTVTVAPGADMVSRQVEVDYTASVNTVFAQVIGMAQMPIGGQALASANQKLAPISPEEVSVISPKAVAFIGQGWSTAAGQNSVHRLSALSNATGGTIADGPYGIISFWTDCSGAYSIGPCSDADFINTRDNYLAICCSSEAASVDLVFDNQGSPPNVRLRLNLNGLGYSNSGPEFQVALNSAMTAADAGKWTHWLLVWDTSGKSKCGAIYKNGQNINASVGDNSGGVGFNAHYSASAGWALGFDDAFGTGVVNAGTAGHSYGPYAAEVYVNLSPSLSPCSGNALANYSIGSFYRSGWPVELGPNCQSPTGAQPTMCFRGDSSTFGTNLGYGGAFTLNNGARTLYDAPSGPHAIPSGTYLKWFNAGSGFPSSFGGFVPSAGDLIVVTAVAIWPSNGASTLIGPIGYTQIGSTIGGASKQSMIVGAWYTIASGSDVAPTVTFGRPGTKGISYIITIYGHVNQASPIGKVGIAYSSDPTSVKSVTCNGYIPSQSDSLQVFVGWNWATIAGSGNDVLSGPAWSLRADLANYESNGWSPELYLADFQNSSGNPVGNSTFTWSSYSLPGGCFAFEIEHP